MIFLVGVIIILLSIVIGFLGSGGNIWVLLQPFECLIIIGTTFGIFINSTPPTLRRMVWGDIKLLKNKENYTKQTYLELLTFMFGLFRFARFQPPIEVEEHIEAPEKSKLFNNYPTVVNNSIIVSFVCDFIRIILLGVKNVHEIELLANQRIETFRNSKLATSDSLRELADALPALGILAAVLGIIIAMSSINGEPIEIGRNIASALIGTFLGVFLSYCIVQPIGLYIKKKSDIQIQIMECLTKGIVSYMKGISPSIIIEFVRQVIPKELQPSFNEIEDAILNIAPINQKKVKNVK